MQRIQCFTVSYLTLALAACEAESASDSHVGAAHAELSASDASAPAASECTPSEVSSPELQGTAKALVLYDTEGEWGYLGELYAAGVGTLASHFGSWHAAPVAQYRSGDVKDYSALIYIGSSYAQPLPAAFLDEVAASAIPVLWIDKNIWQLTSHVPDFQSRYGFMPSDYDTAAIAKVEYKGVTLDRDLSNNDGVMAYAAQSEPSTALAQAVRPDGSKLPWAVHSGALTYIGENPFDYLGETDRYLAFGDMLYDVFGVAVPTERHRALIRIEDVSAENDPDNLRKLADYLASEQVPFSIATIPQYVDPLGAYNDGVPKSVSLSQAPDTLAAIQYMVQRGGTVIMHGYTHQYSNVQNPYSAVSADDYEFYRAHLDATNAVIYDGPVSEDSVDWATQRITAGLGEFAAAGLPRPTIFEWPHYAASDLDAQALRGCFAVVYQQAMYFTGVLSGATPDYQKNIAIFAPYVTQDAYGFEMIPENLGNYASASDAQTPTRSAADIVRVAQANRVVRDGFASFFFHGYYTVEELKPIIDGIKAAGFEFTAASAL
jgi:uncharacterized protein YdaL